jgi:hypothetical protein
MWMWMCRWACVPDDEWPNDPTQRQVIISDFDLDTPYGDRRQEIVFIGANMDEKAICDQLDTALLTQEELVKYHERYSGVGLYFCGYHQYSGLPQASHPFTYRLHTKVTLFMIAVCDTAVANK